ncbi:DUF1328 domain-containing protein [Haladaptatus pallidirubidus]|uniref:DUF1328 domain-containing protein n=1 Tax=Haladaptatus pallidirubidus TaxID=1008152 RepID=UPI001D12FDE5|nr:DUF1328 domain-containing protein [Haladaptatus pallidirubidus]
MVDYLDILYTIYGNHRTCNRFFVLAIIAGVLGARGVASLSMEVAKWLVIIYRCSFIFSFLL